MKRLFIFILFITGVAHAQLPVGTTRTSVVTDGSGNIINTPLAFSNQFNIYVSATNRFEPVIIQQFTNTITIVTNIYPLSVSRGGTGQPTTQLTGSWTNTINFRTSGTNDANAFSLNGILGRTGSISNMSASAGVTNVMVFTNGFLHNFFTIP